MRYDYVRSDGKTVSLDTNDDKPPRIDVARLYGVYLCGPTDCFLHAVFANEKDATAWYEAHFKNPEGGYVAQMDPMLKLGDAFTED